MKDMRMRLLRWWFVLRQRIRTLTRPIAVERELDRELRYHLEREVQESLSRNIPPDEARRAALRSLDGLTTIQEECRDMRHVNHFENLFQDLRYALRAMGRNPGFTAVIVLTLTLAIGANSAIFSVIDGVLIAPLPYPEPGRLVRIFFSNATYPKFRLNPWDFHDFRDRSRSFEGIAAYARHDLQLSGNGDPELIPAIRTTAGYFAVLGIAPARGREFTRNDETQANSQVVILSDRLWRRRFSADPNIIGKTVLFDSLPYVVVGLMPPGVQHPGDDRNALPHGESVDAWTSFAFTGDPSGRGSHFLDGIGRLKKDVTPQQTAAEMNFLIDQIVRAHPKYKTSAWRVIVHPLYQEIVGKSQTLLLILLGAVAAVLLIACVNAANLLLARSTARRQEMAIRAAIGAGRARLLRQLLTESVLIALAGAIGGSLVAVFGVKLLVSLLPAGFPRAQAIHLDFTVFAFTLAIALAAGLLFGFAPALQASRVSPIQTLREGARGSTGGRRMVSLRSLLVVAEIGMASALLIGAGLMLRSFVNLLRSEPGFRPEHVLTVKVALPAAQYQSGESIARFYRRLVADLGAVAGVQAAGASTDVPWTGYNENTDFVVEGRPSEDRPHARYHSATPDYFRAMGIPLIAGRYATDRDTPGATPALLVNQAFARGVWPNENALGKRISFDLPPTWVTVIGVVGDVKDAPNSQGAAPALWWIESQVQPTLAMSLAVRATTDTGPLLDAVRREVHALDPSLAISSVRTMEQVANESLATPRFSMALIGLFACLALGLAAIGMYGVIAYSVGQRAHEFGLRMALGANPWDVQRSVLGDGIKLAAAGVALGVVCALLLSQAVRSLLYEVGASDPATFTAVAVIAIAVASLACYVPARRATRADPMSALRCD
jgi:predicted permease